MDQRSWNFDSEACSKRAKIAIKDICHECLSVIMVKEIVAKRIMVIIPFKEEDVDICGTIPLTNLIL